MSRQRSSQQELIAKRRVARKLSLMAAYQWLMTDDSFQAIYTYFQEDKDQSADLRKADVEYFKSLTRCAMKNKEALDGLITLHTDRPLDQAGPVEHAVLLLSACELQNHMDVPHKVVVNEWINLTKKFGSEQSFKFINGVLSKLVTEIRSHEL